jgi:hypothetical protein
VIPFFCRSALRGTASALQTCWSAAVSENHRTRGIILAGIWVRLKSEEHHKNRWLVIIILD